MTPGRAIIIIASLAMLAASAAALTVESGIYDVHFLHRDTDSDGELGDFAAEYEFGGIFFEWFDYHEEQPSGMGYSVHIDYIGEKDETGFEDDDKRVGGEDEWANLEAAPTLDLSYPDNYTVNCAQYFRMDSSAGSYPWKMSQNATAEMEPEYDFEDFYYEGQPFSEAAVSYNFGVYNWTLRPGEDMYSCCRQFVMVMTVEAHGFPVDNLWTDCPDSSCTLYMMPRKDGDHRDGPPPPIGPADDNGDIDRDLEIGPLQISFPGLGYAGDAKTNIWNYWEIMEQSDEYTNVRFIHTWNHEGNDITEYTMNEIKMVAFSGAAAFAPALLVLLAASIGLLFFLA